MSDNIFDSRGGLRADLENVTVPPQYREVFDALVASVRAAEAAEADVKIKDNALAEAVKARDIAAAAMPVRTFLDEWRASR